MLRINLDPVMPKLAAIVLLVLAPVICHADPPARQTSTADQQLAERWLAQRRKILNDSPKKIRAHTSFRNAMPLAAEIEQKLEDEWAAAKMGECAGPGLRFPLVVGDIGTLLGSSFRVIQRLGNSEARVGIKPVLTERELKEVRVFGPYPEIEVFLRGYDFSGIVEGQECGATGCFIVRKSDQYKPLSGTPRILPVIAPYDTSAALRIVRAAVKLELDREQRQSGERDADRAQREAAEAKARAERRPQIQAKIDAYVLANARMQIKGKLYQMAEQSLRAIIARSPGTDAAVQAKKELDSLPPH
jgi:hypothetical protein